MATKMLIDAAHPEETRVVVVRDGKVEEFDFEAANRQQLRGNIYLAKVTRVEPSLQAAFVDYGGNRHGFLAFSEIHPDYYQIPHADRQALLEAEEADAKADNADDNGDADRPDTGSSKAADGEPDATPQAEPVEDGGSDQTEPSGEAAADAGPEEPAAEAAPENASDDAPQGETAPADDEPQDDGADDKTVASSTSADATVSSEPVEAAPDASASETVGDARDGAADAGPEATAEVLETPSPGDDASEESAVSESAGPENTAEDSASRDGAQTDEAQSLSSEDTAETDGGPDSSPDSGNDDINGGVEDAPSEDEAVESVGGDDAMEEVPVRKSRPRRNYKIQEVIKKRQILLVQVVKEERGNKGAALTTYLSLAGRYSVLMPNTARGGGISRKIVNATDRKRLKGIAGELDVPEGMGVILRTAGASRTKAEIKRDFEYLLRLWENVRELTLKSVAPTLVYEEGSLVKRAIRDLYTKDIEQVQVSGDEAYREAKDFMRMLMPSHAKNIQPYREPDPIFGKYRVESQLDAMFSPQVTMKSGGYIVMNQTEALVSIDVNSGRSTREHNIEDTALKTNLEAADEVARQLRLRDLAGLIVIDFIDMEEKRNNKAVERRLKEALRRDRARIQVGRISHFGLLEMSRQRIRSSVLDSTMQLCAHCEGTGRVRSVESVALQLLRAIEGELLKGKPTDLAIRTRASVALYVLNQKRMHLRELEDRFSVIITVDADETLGASAFEMEKGEPARAQDRDTVIRPISVSPDLDEAETDREGAPEASAPAASADEESGGKRRRRRRRRRSSSNDDAAVETTTGETEAADAEVAETEESEQASTEGGGDGQSGEQQQGGRRRRRGRRGGRRHRGDQAATTQVSEEQPSIEAPAEWNFGGADAAAKPEADTASETAEAAQTPAAETADDAPASAEVAAASEETEGDSETTTAAETPEKPARRRRAPRRAKAKPEPEVETQEVEMGEVETAEVEMGDNAEAVSQPVAAEPVGESADTAPSEPVSAEQASEPVSAEQASEPEETPPTQTQDIATQDVGAPEVAAAGEADPAVATDDEAPALEIVEGTPPVETAETEPTAEETVVQDTAPPAPPRRGWWRRRS